MKKKSQGNPDGKAAPKAGGNGEGSVSYGTYQKVLDQLKKTQAKSKDLEDMITKIENDRKAADDEKLNKDGNFKQLLESKTRELTDAQKIIKDLTGEVTGYKQSFIESKKINALLGEIGGKVKHKDYYNLIDTSKIALLPDSEDIDSVSLKQYAGELLNDHKHLFDFAGGKMPSGAPSGGVGISRADWNKLAVANPKEAKERHKDIID